MTPQSMVRVGIWAQKTLTKVFSDNLPNEISLGIELKPYNCHRRKVTK